MTKRDAESVLKRDCAKLIALEYARMQERIYEMHGKRSDWPFKSPEHYADHNYSAWQSTAVKVIERVRQ